MLLGLALCAGACSRGDGDADTPTGPSPSGNSVHYTVIGASDGLGVGGSVVCAFFDLDCENGTGYAQTLRRRFRADGHTVGYDNLSVPGTVLSPAIVDLAREIGRSDPGNFLDRYPQFVRAGTTHVTIFAGGNDANIIGTAVSNGLGGGNPRAFIDAHVRQWGQDLVELVARIRNRAPRARIVAFNLPNLGTAPYLSGRTVQERSVMQRIATGLADQVNTLTSRNVLVVDLACDPRIIQPSSFAADGFHPSDAGYALMAELAYPVLAGGTAATPQPSCGPRTVLPAY